MDFSARKKLVETDNPTEKFWKEVPAAIHDGQSLYYVVDSYIDAIRQTIDDSSQTAKFIDSKESWQVIKNSAQAEGLISFAEAVEFIDSVLED